MLLRSTVLQNRLIPSGIIFVTKRLPGFYALRQQKDRKDDFPIKTGNKLDDTNLKEELPFYQNFLVYSEPGRATHEIFRYAIKTLNATIVAGKLDHFFKSMKCAAKVNLVFRFNLKNIEKAWFRFFYEHENKYLARVIQTCVHQRRLGEAKGLSQQN